MAVNIVAAAQCFPCRCFVWLFVYVLLLVLHIPHWVNKIYSRHKILKIGVCHKWSVTAEFLHSHNILMDIARSPSSLWIIITAGRRQRRRCERKQKRGCRAGAIAKLREQSLRPPLPSLFPTNARSLANKMNELRLQTATKHCER